MQYITRLSLGSVLLVGTLAGVSYLTAQQGPTQQSKETQSALPQQSNPPRNQLEQLEAQIRNLQTAVDNLSAVRAEDREALNEALRTVGRGEKQTDKLQQQVSKITFDLDRVKTKLGLY